jgi:ABC-type transporter Mla subunit MlaD
LDVRPELGDRPVEVVMTINTSYKLTVPNDSVVRLATEGGVLGPTVVEIDTRKAIGPPIQDNGVLPSMEITDSRAARVLEFIGNTFLYESRKLRDTEKPLSPPTNSSK